VVSQSPWEAAARERGAGAEAEAAACPHIDVLELERWMQLREARMRA